MKNIIEVMGSRSTKYGGVEKFMIELIKSNNNAIFHLIYNEYPRDKKYVDDLQQLGANIIILNCIGKGMFTNILAFRNIVKSIRPDIVHFHFSSVHALWAPLCKYMGVKRLFHTAHCCVFQNGKNVNSINEMSMFHRILTRWGKAYKIFDYNLCVSTYVMQQFIKVYGDYSNNKVVYLGTNNPPSISADEKERIRQKYGVTKNTKVLLTVMFADPLKGCDVIINALPKIKGNYKLFIIGMDNTSQYTKQMQNYAEYLAVQDNIVWIGITNRVHDFMSIADVFIQPSRTEALSLAAVEAMSHSLPVVATNVGGLPEVTSCLFESEDAQGLSNLVSDLINNNDMCKKVGHMQFERWQHTFSMKTGVEQYTYLYKEQS